MHLLYLMRAQGSRELLNCIPRLIGAMHTASFFATPEFHRQCSSHLKASPPNSSQPSPNPHVSSNTCSSAASFGDVFIVLVLLSPFAVSGKYDNFVAPRCRRTHSAAIRHLSHWHQEQWTFKFSGLSTFPLLYRIGYDQLSA